MNPQPDRTIDHVLTALRDTPAPTGLEARIAHRLLHAQASPVRPATGAMFPAVRQTAATFFAVILERAQRTKDPRILLATAAATALAVAIAIAIPNLHHHQLAAGKLEAGSWQAESQLQTTSTAPTPNAVILSGVSRGLMRETQSKDLPTARIPTAAQALPTPPPDDPDTIALAETLAPSQPIPTQPLTAQERLLLSATRQGQPIEVAELELAREPLLRAAAAAREQSTSARFTFAQVARSLLAPLAEAEALQPTTTSTEPTTESPR